MAVPATARPFPQHEPDAVGIRQDANIGQRVAVDHEEIGQLGRLDRSDLGQPERPGGTFGRRSDRRRRTQPALGHPDELDRVGPGRATVVAHRERHARLASRDERAVRLVLLAHRLLDESRDELRREALREVVEGAQRRDEDDAVLGHAGEQLRLPVQREPVLHRVDPLLDRESGAV